MQREVRDRDYFYIWSYSAWGVWAALGLVYVWQSVAQILDRDPSDKPDKVGYASRRAWLLATPLLLIACIPVAANWRAASHRGETFTADWGYDLLNSVEPYGILITNGDNDTFPLWYAQEVEGVRQDVLVLVTSYLNTDWFVRQVIRRPVRPYDAAKGPAIYRGRTGRCQRGRRSRCRSRKRTRFLRTTRSGSRSAFAQRNLIATIQPGYLTRDQIVTLRLIKDAYPERPIYFSTGGYGRTLGLGNYTLRQGLAEKLVENPIVAGKDTVRVADGFLDVPRTYALWTQVYKAPAALIKRGDWIDRPSFGIPYTYAVTGMVLADALKSQGKTAQADTVIKTVIGIAKAARLTDVLANVGGGGG